MTITLQFNLPEEKEEFDLVMKAPKMHSALWNFNEYMVQIINGDIELDKKNLEDMWLECMEDVEL